MSDRLTEAELRYCLNIASKDSALRGLLDARQPGAEPAGMFDYLVAVKNILGNLNNDISFVASLLVKPFLRQRFGIEFDAALKPQGAPGMDVDCTLQDGTRIVGELKTTKPYQPGFGAAQKREITKDLLRLAGTVAADSCLSPTPAAILPSANLRSHRLHRAWKSWISFKGKALSARRRSGIRRRDNGSY
jgi:hypothetical protein